LVARYVRDVEAAGSNPVTPTTATEGPAGWPGPLLLCSEASRPWEEWAPALSLLCCCAAVLLCCCAAVLLCCCAAVLLCCCAAATRREIASSGAIVRPQRDEAVVQLAEVYSAGFNLDSLEHESEVAPDAGGVVAGTDARGDDQPMLAPALPGGDPLPVLPHFVAMDAHGLAK
jgi:hypothetical protein